MASWFRTLSATTVLTTQADRFSSMFLFVFVEQSLWGRGGILGFYAAGEQPAPRCKSPVPKCALHGLWLLAAG